MNNGNSNNESASSLKNKDIDLYHNTAQQKQQDCCDVEPFDPKSNLVRNQSVFNPFNKKIRQSLTFKESFRFSKQKQGNDKSQKLSTSRQSNPFKKSQLPKDSCQFDLKPQQVNQKQSQQFMFKGNLSGSLFSSQKSEKNQQKDIKSKNLQNYISLLNQYYNDTYLLNMLQISRKSNAPASHLSIRRSQVPYFITREPILFHKKFYGLRSGKDLSGNFLCKLIGNKIYYKNVSSQEIQFSEGVKCDYIELPQAQSVSPSLQIDASSLHLFYYSNTKSQIVVLSLSKNRNNNNEICRIKTRTQRTNPLLYLIQINQQTILLLIGGYSSIHPKQKLEEVQGSKYIEIFPIDKWGTGIMESRIIKLINGKIFPLIIFPVKIELNDSILLVGGNTMARSDGNNLSFKDYKVVNRSSNVRGMFISTKSIIQCIEQNKDIITLPNGQSKSLQWVCRLCKSKPQRKNQTFLAQNDPILYFENIKKIGSNNQKLLKSTKTFNFQLKLKLSPFGNEMLQKTNDEILSNKLQRNLSGKINTSGQYQFFQYIKLMEMSLLIHVNNFVYFISRGSYIPINRQKIAKEHQNQSNLFLLSSDKQKLKKSKFIYLVIKFSYFLQNFYNLVFPLNYLYFREFKVFSSAMSKDFYQMNSLRKVLASNTKISSLLNLVRMIMEKYKNRPEKDFLNSNELGFLREEMEKIHINEIENLLDGISNPETIIALPLSIEKYFTLFFVIVPRQQQFNWHDHPKMTGFTKCVHGKLRITSMDRKFLKEHDGLYYFPLQNLRIQILQSKTNKNLSAIYPEQFNVHKIEALQISAFFDLLMPDYPEDICTFFNTIEEKQGMLVLQKLENSVEQIKGFDVALKELSQVKKVENIILK